MSQYSLEERPNIQVIGIECRTSNNPEDALKDIPAHWQRFFEENIIEKVPHKSSSEVIALYCDYEGDHTQSYSLVIGCPVSSLEEIPEGMVSKTIPGGSFALFRAVGEHPQTLIETWGKIWQTDLSRTYTGDYEIYGEKFTSRSPQEVDVFIAVK